MGKHLAVILAMPVLVVVGLSKPVLGSMANIPVLASGQQIIGVVNADDDDSLTDDQDCKITAGVGEQDSGNGLGGAMGATLPITVTGTQSNIDDDTVLQHCDVLYRGTASQNHGIELNLRENEMGNRQSIIHLLSQLSSDSFTPTFAVGGASGDPETIGAAELENIFGAFRGNGFLCNSGGPKLQMTLDNGVRVLLDIEPFPDSSDPTHMCVKSVPFEIGFGEFDTHDVCFPVDENGNIVVGTEETTFFIVMFDDLPACTLGRQAAPSASEWGLIFLSLALLGGGSWFLSRRRALAESLPRL
jgi:hypothetical protein